jgi:hypothetical protein
MKQMTNDELRLHYWYIIVQKFILNSPVILKKYQKCLPIDLFNIMLLCLGHTGRCNDFHNIAVLTITGTPDDFKSDTLRGHE